MKTTTYLQQVHNKLAKALKKRLAAIRTPKKFIKLDQIPDQPEIDDNAINEALEARLMEVIAMANQQEDDVIFRIGDSSFVPFVPSCPEKFAIGSFWVPETFPQIQTKFQQPEVQH